MPKITVPLSVNYDAISRPVAMGVARDVMRLTSIPETTPIFMPGEFNEVNQPNQEMGGSGEATFESHRRLIVRVDEDIRNESIIECVVRQNQLPPILADDKLGVSVRPVYLYSDMTLSFRYIAATRHEAIKWRDEVATARAENRTAVSHEVAYDIPIQDGVIALLAHIHQLREKVAGYGESFPQYFQSIQRRQVATVGTRDGDIDGLNFTVPEKQVNVTGYFDFNAIPREVKEDNNSTWVIEWSYKFTYHRAARLYIVYPLVVHQSHIGSQYFSKKTYYGIEELNKRGSIGVTALDVIDGEYNWMPPVKDGIRFPMYDEWIPGPRSQPPQSVSSISWMIQLNPKDPQDILNLTELPQIRLTLEMDVYMKIIHKTLHKRGGGLCFLTLFSGDVAMDESLLTVDEQLNVRATRPLDLRKEYHLRLSFPTHYPLFSRETIREMQRNWKATLQTFQSILPSLDIEHAVSILVGGEYVPQAYIAWFYKYLRDHGIGYDGSNGGGVGGVINTGRGEAGALPGGGGTGGIGGPGKDGNWTNPIWNPNGHGGVKFVQFLAIATVKRD